MLITEIMETSGKYKEEKVSAVVEQIWTSISLPAWSIVF